MTNKELYEKEIERLQGILPETDPRTDAYTKVLFALRELDVLSSSERFTPAGRSLIESLARCAGRKTAVEAGSEGKDEEPQDEEPQDEEPQDEVPTYESVREALNQARGRGVLLQPIIMKFVPEGSPAKFSSIPAESYPALMEELKDA